MFSYDFLADRDRDSNSDTHSHSSRKFRPAWKDSFPWLSCSENGNAICTVCCEAVTSKLPLPPMSRNNQNAMDAVVTNGFSTWSRATSAFKSHEQSDFHRANFVSVSNRKKPSVIQHLSNEKLRTMKEARLALAKIFHTILFIGREGLPFRGTYNVSDHSENSKFMRILKMRAEDVPELKSWLQRSGYKWLHHDVVEEILKMIADHVLNKVLNEVRREKYFSIMIDETSDISRLEQVCIALRYVTDELVVKEQFVGFYQTGDTKADTLFNIVKDMMIRFQLNMNDIRGQCYDGASNVSGHISGLQTKILEHCSTALFVHCVAHHLNLVQDALTNITDTRDFIGTVQKMISFVRGSPRRLAEFSNFQDDNAPKLSPYCPTRWCMRVKSLKTIKDNYAALMDFFNDVGHDSTFDTAITSTAFGYYDKLKSFSFYFHLISLIYIFERIENLNSALQKVDLHFSESHASIDTTKKSLQKLRQEGFLHLWQTLNVEVERLNIEQPSIPRLRKAPKRYESQSTVHVFQSANDFYRRKYFEVLDAVILSLDNRFKSDTLNFLLKVENFVLKKGDHNSYADDIVTFYKEDSFDKDRLILHRDSLLDVMIDRSGIVPKSITDVVNFARHNLDVMSIIPQMFKLLKIILTIPASNCTCERCFSALRRLKSYLRSTMLAERLNHISILHVHQSTDVDLESLMNEFICRNAHRKVTFSL